MNDTVTIEIPEPVYTMFDAKRDGLPEIIVVNRALLGFAHNAVFPWYLCVTIEARELIDNGMPAPAEQELLYRLGDEIEETVVGGRTGADAVNALFLARSTWDGLRQLLFYVHDPEIAHAALQSLLASRTWEREWDYRMEGDDEWEKAGFVFQLFSPGKDAH
jgi:hypothetical protein